MPNGRQMIALGRIIGVHGVKGWVKIHSDCRPREGIFDYAEFSATRNQQLPATTLHLSDGHVQGKGLVAKFNEANTRDEAMALIGQTLSVSREALPELEDDAFYWADIIGLEVVNRENVALGTVIDIFETGANDVIIVKHANKEILIPFVVGQYIDAADFETNQLHVDWQLDWSEISAEDVEK